MPASVNGNKLVLEEIELQPIDESQSDFSKPKAITVPSKQYGRVIAIVAFYMIASVAMILLNKAVLRVIPLPITLLWLQMIVAVVAIKSSAFLFGMGGIEGASWSGFKGVYWLIGINVLGLALNTLCLHLVDAIMYQVARSLVIPFTVVLTPLLLKKESSIPIMALFACGIICAGFIYGMFGEAQSQISERVTVVGMVFGVASSLTTALHSFAIKHAMTKAPKSSDTHVNNFINDNGNNSKSQGNTWSLVYSNNLYSAIMIMPLLLLEVPQVVELLTSVADGDWTGLENLLFGGLLTGGMGLLINLASFLQIHYTSPLSHTVSSAARGVLQTIAAHAILGEKLTIPRLVSISMVLVGTILYTVAKQLQASPAK